MDVPASGGQVTEVTGIDRLAPTRRPDEGAVMKQRWADLLFLHWAVDADGLRARLPPGVELDTFEGRAYIGIVPFTVRGARLTWLPALPWVSHFHEVNLRTYVHHRGQEPGVWFFTLDAANPVVVQTARTLFRLPYRHAHIEMSADDPGGSGPGTAADRRWIRFTSCRREGDPPDLDVRYGPGGAPAPARPGTLEFFLLERYVLFTVSEGRLYRARVHHPAYPAQPAVVPVLRENFLPTIGLSRPEGPPLAHYASEVQVEVFPLREVE
jgi:uncharacterized protein YqjF (DUF2071 family)